MDARAVNCSSFNVGSLWRVGGINGSDSKHNEYGQHQRKKYCLGFQKREAHQTRYNNSTKHYYNNYDYHRHYTKHNDKDNDLSNDYNYDIFDYHGHNDHRYGHRFYRCLSHHCLLHCCRVFPYGHPENGEWLSDHRMLVWLEFDWQLSSQLYSSNQDRRHRSDYVWGACRQIP
jgi:hypothetical protein